jgi:hypothetical protein
MVALNEPQFAASDAFFMETIANSPQDYPAVSPQKSSGKSAITNGSCLLPGVDGRSPWVRRCKDILAAHLSDKPDATAAEQAIIRRAAVLTVELERLERQFALAGEADPETLELYGRVAGNMRRMLEAVGLERRSRTVTANARAQIQQLYLSALRRANSEVKTTRDSIGSNPSEPK